MGEMCTARLYSHRGFALKFYLGSVIPINHSWRQKTRHTGPLRSLILTEYRSVTEEQTDGRTDGFAVALLAYTTLAKLALRLAVA